MKSEYPTGQDGYYIEVASDRTVDLVDAVGYQVAHFDMIDYRDSDMSECGCPVRVDRQKLWAAIMDAIDRHRELVDFADNFAGMA